MRLNTETSMRVKSNTEQTVIDPSSSPSTHPKSQPIPPTLSGHPTSSTSAQLTTIRFPPTINLVHYHHYHHHHPHHAQ
ncbi:hypothetical protein PGT21_008320 [Puccinia graminis f. sp. tritici]|uniref:Uncharacterized protein n=1 Tax=Puccinia graminis f. sp. tritici TaxID=56615 RepID=A0A5B0LLF1_PUCGR|nr:hypothetical protein PGTUg99_009415 [Puccinia graminis f. sp. tritici]KAA1065717.1 hypothetical protein PGT21_008320 [Puccinia graminis f. sp. tritici]